MRDLNRSSTLSIRRPSGSTSTSTRAVASNEAASATTHQPALPATPAGADRALRSDALLQGRSHVNIVHNGETYQLRATRLGKLILTK
jgi:hemin uptake protein HemP